MEIEKDLTEPLNNFEEGEQEEEVIEEFEPQEEKEKCITCIKCGGFKISLLSFVNGIEKVTLNLRCEICGFVQGLELSREQENPAIPKFKSVTYCG
jgi:hypothetical protein